MRSVPRGPRERLIGSAIELVRVYGVHGTGVSDLLKHSHTARGSIYQHFPGGKSELLAESTGAAAAWARRAIKDVTAQTDVATAIVMVTDLLAKGLVAEEFKAGCPIAAAAAAAPENAEVRDAAARAFETWTAEVAAALRREGRTAEDAESLAGFIVNAVEGALLVARCSRSPEPLNQAAKQLRTLLAGEPKPSP